MKRLLLVLIFAAGVIAGCTPPPNDIVPDSPSAWVNDALAGHPDLQEEMRGTNHAFADDPAYPWSADAFMIGGQTGIRWHPTAPTWHREYLLDVAAHEAAHIMAMRRWDKPFPPGWPTNGKGFYESAESYADCLATYLRNHIVIAHGGCVGNPADAYQALINTPKKAGIR